AWVALSRLADGRWSPARLVGAHPRPAIAIAATGVAALLVATRPAAPHPWPERAEIAVLDVGQGQAVLLRDAAGGATLVDAGPPGSPAPVVEALDRHGVERLDALVLTHPALDHVGGTVSLLDAVRVVRVLVPPLARDEPHGPTAEALEAAADRGVEVVEVRAGALLRAGAWKMAILWPQRPPTAGVDPNRGSLVMRASTTSWRALLAADAESPTLGPLPIGRVDALVVGHHGSADPGLGALLGRLRPDVGLISVGAGNRFGHPDDRTLAQLGAAGVAVHRTDRQGDLIVQRDANGLVVAPSR
ncbi:MAG: ComEC/Rec2 family competence protein, partial [Miltoncostaeaceae bacterium]